MIDAQFYRPIYFLIIFFLTLWFTNKLRPNYISENNKYCVLLTLFFILFIGFRPVSHKYFVDMYGTALQFSLWARSQIGFFGDVENLLYDNLRINMATLGFTYRPFFIIIASIYFGGMYFLCTRIFNHRKMIALLTCLAAFSSFSFGTNGVKAGAAASIFLIAIALQHNRHGIYAIFFAILSIGFHHSMILPVIASVVCKYYHKHRHYYYLWGVCFLLAMFRITYFQNLFADIGSDSSRDYLSGVGIATKGFRIDFVLYSAVPILLGAWLEIRKYHISEKYKDLLNLYMLINAVWMLCMYAEFTNRIAYLSWLMYPIVLIYPFINESALNNKLKLMKLFVWGHLCFTMFMEFVFYA